MVLHGAAGMVLHGAAGMVLQAVLQACCMVLQVWCSRQCCRHGAAGCYRHGVAGMVLHGAAAMVLQAWCCRHGAAGMLHGAAGWLHGAAGMVLQACHMVLQGATWCCRHGDAGCPAGCYMVLQGAVHHHAAQHTINPISPQSLYVLEFCNLPINAKIFNMQTIIFKIILYVMRISFTCHN